MKLSSQYLGNAVIEALRLASTWIPPLASWVRRSAGKYAACALESYKRGDYDQALAYFRQALGWEPLDANFRSALGQLYYEQGKLEEAEEQFRKALDSDYQNLRALKGLGAVLQEKNKLLDAMYVYLRYVDVEPKDAIVCYNLGVVFYTLGKYEDAVEWYGRAEEQDPDDPLVRKSRAIALLALGRLDDARSTLLRARELAQEDAGVDHLLGLILALQGETVAALESYEASLRKDPENRDAHLESAQLAAGLGRYTEAIEHAKTAADLFRQAGDDRGAAVSYWHLGWSYYMAGNLPASLQASTEALKLNSDLTPVHFNLGLALLQSGRAAEARKEYEEGVARLSEVSDLKVHAIDDLHEALEKNPQLNGAAEILAMLEHIYASLSEELVRSAAQSTVGHEKVESEKVEGSDLRN